MGTIIFIMANAQTKRAAGIERCISVIRHHPNTGSSLGPLKKWLEAIYDDKKRGDELRKLIQDVAKDNTLADHVSTMVERYSELHGDPWKRNVGKKTNTNTPKKTNGQSEAATPSEGQWQVQRSKKKGKGQDEKRCEWAALILKLEPYSWPDEKGDEHGITVVISSSTATRDSVPA